MSATFNWDQFEQVQAPVQVQNKSQPTQPNQPSPQFDWAQFQEEPVQVDQEQPTTNPILGNIKKGLSFAGRQAVRLPSRVFETVVAAPRELGEFAESLVPEKAIIKGAEKIGLKQGAENLLDYAKKYAPYKAFPTSEQTKDFTKQLFGKYAEPKNDFERIQDEVISDAAALALPIGGELKAIRPALTSLGAQLAKQGVKWFGGSEKAQDLAKLGVVATSAFVRPKETEQLKNSLYKAARQARPEDATVSSIPLQDALHELEIQIKKGGITDSGKPALERIRGIRKEIQGAQVPVEALEASKRKINEVRTGVYKLLEGNKPGIKTAKRNLDNVSRAVDNALDLYGKQNPTWHSLYRPANEVNAAIESSKKARRWMLKNYKGLGVSGAAALFGLEQALGPLGTAATAATGGTGLLLGEQLARVSKSPTLRKYYTEVISSALAEDLPKFKAANKKLESALIRDEQQ